MPCCWIQTTRYVYFLFAIPQVIAGKLRLSDSAVFALLQLFSIGLAHFLKQNYILKITWTNLQTTWQLFTTKLNYTFSSSNCKCLSTSLQMIKYR